jgi:hypothetical protein
VAVAKHVALPNLAEGEKLTFLAAGRPLVSPVSMASFPRAAAPDTHRITAIGTAMEAVMPSKSKNFEAFTSLVAQLLKVSITELDQRQAEYR